MGGQARANAVRTANAKRQQNEKTRQAVRPQDAGRGKEMIKRSSEQFAREAAARANASLGSKMIDSSALNAAQALRVPTTDGGNADPFTWTLCAERVSRAGDERARHCVAAAALRTAPRR